MIITIASNDQYKDNNLFFCSQQICLVPKFKRPIFIFYAVNGKFYVYVFFRLCGVEEIITAQTTSFDDVMSFSYETFFDLKQIKN
jgi:hypothetical protein